MNPHDISGWQLSHQDSPTDWAQLAITVLCILVIALWAYDYIEGLV